MAPDIPTLCARVQRGAMTVLDNIAPIADAVRDVEGGVGALPPVARGLIASVVSREVARNTGQDIPSWVTMLDALTMSMRKSQTVAGRVMVTATIGAGDRACLTRVAGQVDAAQPRFERLAAFMEAAPRKVRRVPTTIVPAARREAFLQMLAGQEGAIRRALAAMPELSRDLRALAGGM
ncbi:MAG: hypothetical protein LC769_09940 [Chloroflexi bacterium]|nr:hypothetical protein [Chloroflexota bacterium]